MTIRVMVFATIAPEQADRFEAAYLQVTERMRGTPGLLRDELLHDADRPGTYVLLGEWESEEHFRSWESAAGHQEISAPMRPFWTGRAERRIYRLAARLEETEPAVAGLHG
jgi:heme-degrading monooxygenase HmoA